MLGELIPCGGGPPIALQRSPMIVGRTDACDVTLPYKTVSSRHCRLEFRQGHWYVDDLDSRNGVRVNDARTRSGRLMPGDILWIAQHRFEVQYAAPPSPATAERRAATQPSRPDSRERADRPAQFARLPAGTPDLGHLVPCGGGDPIPLLSPKLLVGRSSRCDVTLRFPDVSARHCALEFRQGFWRVRDLDSRNGIRVDGIREKSKYLLPHNVLSIAKHRYEVVYQPQGDAPPMEEDPFALSLLEKAGLQKAIQSEKRPGWMVDDGHVRPEKYNLDD